MKSIIFLLSILSAFSAMASDLRQEYSEAKALNKLSGLQTFEIRDSEGFLLSRGGNWKCEGEFQKLAFVPLTNDQWWSPKTSAEFIQLRNGKVVGLSSTSSKEIAFRISNKSLLVEFNNRFDFKNSQPSIEDTERFATGYAKCTPVAKP